MAKTGASTKEKSTKNKMHKVRFETETGLPKTFRDHGLEYSKNQKGDIIKHQMLDEPFVIKNGQTMELDDKTYKYLKEKGSIISAAEKDEVDRLRRRRMKKKAARAEPKKDYQTWDDDTMTKVFNPHPFDVVDE